MSSSIVVGLSAVVVAADESAPHVLATRHDGTSGLPHGPFDPVGDRTFELGLRRWVHAQTGFAPGYVEQLYTFGDRGRELPQADIGDAPPDSRLISVGYLGLTPERTDISGFDAVWTDWYRFFPWEDHRGGRPAFIDNNLAPALTAWANDTSKFASQRLDRVLTSFGLDGRPRIEERTLERYELLYEAGLAPEADRDIGSESAPSSALPASCAGVPMISDHRRILATAIGRLRGKIKYRPVVFELTPPTFTLSSLQKTIESLLGLALHKQNFRRSLDRAGLVEGTSEVSAETGGRPAELFRFRREALREGARPGVQTPKA